MGKLNVEVFSILTPEDFRVLTAIEMGMKNHELINTALIATIAGLKCGVSKILKFLTKHRLISYERGKRFDGYRLTNSGYDYLALYALTKRGDIASFGYQIGVGKESNIYVVADSDGQEYCLKLHRLGRTCFRKVKDKRDYHQKRKSASWLYLSRISATKEFAYMKALASRGFPIPQPISCNRHVVLMELISGTLLNHIGELQNVEALYDKLMNLIVRFAECGVIHGDFNEFNILIREDEEPIIIDFPQMTSTEHPNAEMYFDRDVHCIREFFKKRFGFESELYPEFGAIKRTNALDAEVRCAGLTAQMAKELNIEFVLGEEEDENEEEGDEGKGKNEDTDDDGSFKEEEIEGSENDDNQDDRDVEDKPDEKESEPENCYEASIENDEDQLKFVVDDKNSAKVQNWLDKSSSHLESSNHYDTNDLCEGIDDLKLFTEKVAAEKEKLHKSERTLLGVKHVEELKDECKFEKVVQSDTEVHKRDLDRCASRSIYSSATTIDPSEIKKRVAKQMAAKRRRDLRKLCVAKGEASLAFRSRKENYLTVKDHDNDFWG